MTNLDSVLQSRDITLLTKVCIVKAMVFPVVTYRCESWTIKKAECWRTGTVVLEKTLESPLNSKECKPVNPKGNQPWMFIGRTDAEAEAPILWPPDAKNWLIGNDPDAGKDWEQGEKGATEHEMAGWITDSMNRSLSKLQKIMKDRGARCATVHRITKSQPRLSGWTTSAESYSSEGAQLGRKGPLPWPN